MHGRETSAALAQHYDIPTVEPEDDQSSERILPRGAGLAFVLVASLFFWVGLLIGLLV